MKLPTIEDIELKTYLWNKGISDDDISSYIKVNEKICEYIDELSIEREQVK
jgi:hypothetical protein